MEEKNLRLAGIIRESITDGPGIRFVVFCQGCPHHCEGCHNKETWSYDGGKLVSIDKILNAIDQNGLINGVTFSGGEPFEQAHQFLKLAKEIRKRNLDIMIYTGYKYEDLKAKNDPDIDELIHLSDYIVDGPFELDKRDISLKFRGSTNQRIIDVKETEKMEDSSKIMLAKEFMVC